MKKLPKIVYVQREEESNGESYLLANESAADANEGQIGVYELKETKTRRTEIHLD